VSDLKNIIAFDGGGTKTRCIIGNASGNILADCLGGPSNHQMIGKDDTKKILRELLADALQSSGLDKKDIAYAYLGLAGADLKPDFQLLNGICAELFGDIPFEVANDTWIIMRSGLKDSWGAVSVCGTGSNAGAVHPDGERTILRALGYPLGGYGGGGDMAVEALHHGFRSDEQTGPYSLLEKELPKLFNLKDMDDLLNNLYPVEKISFDDYRKIPPLVFDLALSGDSVSQEILIKMGRIQGEMVAGMIKKLDMGDLEVPVVLGGSIFKGSCTLFIDALEREIRKTAPKAYMSFPDLPPVAGALLSGFDNLGLKLTDTAYAILKRNF